MIRVMFSSVAVVVSAAACVVTAVAVSAAVSAVVVAAVFCFGFFSLRCSLSFLALPFSSTLTLSSMLMLFSLTVIVVAAAGICVVALVSSVSLMVFFHFTGLLISILPRTSSVSSFSASSAFTTSIVNMLETAVAFSLSAAVMNVGLFPINPLSGFIVAVSPENVMVMSFALYAS